MTSTLTSKPTLNPALRSFWTMRARNKVLYGGRSSSKSWDAAGIAIFLSNKYTLRFCCARQIQNKIEESVYTLLKIQIDRFGLRHRFRILNNKIINRVTGSEFVFYGLWRNIEEIKSLEGIDVLWLEEAHALTEYQWKILEPTIRKEGSECWFIFNPGLVTDFVWRNFVVDPPEGTLIRKINYDENP
ncbi:PBSX family phage terminase large subunit, partial [Shigella flexneri]